MGSTAAKPLVEAVLDDCRDGRRTAGDVRSRTATVLEQNRTASEAWPLYNHRCGTLPPFLLAIEADRQDLAVDMLAHALTIGTEFRDRVLWSHDGLHRRALHIAAAMNKFELVEWLLFQGLRPTPSSLLVYPQNEPGCDPNGRTARKLVKATKELSIDELDCSKQLAEWLEDLIPNYALLQLVQLDDVVEPTAEQFKGKGANGIVYQARLKAQSITGMRLPAGSIAIKAMLAYVPEVGSPTRTATTTTSTSSTSATAAVPLSTNDLRTRFDREMVFPRLYPHWALLTVYNQWVGNRREAFLTIPPDVLTDANATAVPTNYFSSNTSYISMECATMNMEQWLQNREPLQPRVALLIVAQLLSALAHIESAGFRHLDIKLDNVFLVDRPNIVPSDPPVPMLVLGDFGTSVPGITAQNVGCFEIQPPEVRENVLSGVGFPVEHADLWSLGWVVFALLQGRAPTTEELLMDRRDGSIPELSPEWTQPDPETQALYRVLTTLLKHEPTERKTAQELLESIEVVLWPTDPQPPNADSPEALRWLLEEEPRVFNMILRNTAIRDSHPRMTIEHLLRLVRVLRFERAIRDRYRAS